MNAILQGGAEPQPDQCTSLLDDLKAQPVWLLWRSEPNPDPTKKDLKVPYYVGGGRRQGTLDSTEDRSRLVTFAEARAEYDLLPEAFTGLAFAAGPDGRGGCWQVIDLDAIEQKGLADIANRWVRGDCAGWGYVEVSPSESGAHIIGYGRDFRPMVSNTSGIEAYCRGHFFTFTGRSALNDSPCRTVDLADYVEKELAPRHAAGRARAANDAEVVPVDAQTVADLRSALLHMRSDERALWVNMGMALKPLGEVGRGMWMGWSATSEKFDPKEAAYTWDSYEPRATGYKAVFAEAMRQGWPNPRDAEAVRHGAEVAAAFERSAQAQHAEPASDTARSFTLEFAMTTDTATLKLEYLLDPWLPLRCVVGFFGRGSTAKSSFLASMSAAISGFGSTLWISVEEPDDWIKVRHIRCGGADQTLAVVKAIESKRDREGRVVASSFNVLADLEPAIEQAKAAFTAQQRPPLRLVVLDTAVGLTNWGRGESPNDDAAVKKLLAYLQAWAEKYDLTVAIIGHSNKGTHDHLADSVMGAAAWTNSPRLSFIHAADRREDHTYVVRTAKTNFEAFGAPYRTVPVHTLYERQGGPDTVLVRVEPEPIVWGSVDSMEMFKEATKVPVLDSDGDDFISSPPKVPEVVLGALIEAVLTVPVGECVTREQVEQRYGKPVDRARWQKVETQLIGHPAVKVERGDKNKALYRRTL